MNGPPTGVRRVLGARTGWHPAVEAGGRPALAAVRQPRALERVAAVIRERLGVAGTDVPGLLDAVCQALGADRLFHVRERGPDLEVVGVPDRHPRRVPRGIWAGLSRDTAVGEGAARRLCLELGAGGPHVRAAFCAGAPDSELLVGNWRDEPPPPASSFQEVADLVGAARAAVEMRSRTVNARLLQERTRLAFDLHDGLVQAVTGALLDLHALRHRIAHSAEAASSLEILEQEIRRSLGELRAILFDLSGPSEVMSLKNGDLREAIAGAVRDLAERWNLATRVAVEGKVETLPEPILDAALVVLREGLANAAKHASSGDVRVRLSGEAGELRVEVEDGGCGFHPDAAGEGRHLGLGLMRRRVEEAGGCLEVESSPGNGTRLVARLPVGEGDLPSGERGERP